MKHNMNQKWEYRILDFGVIGSKDSATRMFIFSWSSGHYHMLLFKTIFLQVLLASSFYSGPVVITTCCLKQFAFKCYSHVYFVLVITTCCFLKQFAFSLLQKSMDRTTISNLLP